MTDHPPAWLFSFVDLAFLLLIAMTQFAGEGNGIALELGEIIVPQVHAEATTELPGGSPERWQLRVHPPGELAEQPFELTLPGRSQESPPVRMNAEQLEERLVTLHARGGAKPLLAPHEDSRSQNMLEAVGMIEELWPSRRRATVAKVFAGR
jgi:hypothetical protein